MWTPFSGDPLHWILVGWLFSVALMLVLWVVQQVKRDAGVVDVGWCMGIGCLAIYYATVADGWGPRRWVVATLAATWAFRLALYILLNRVIGREEDGRYRRLRRHWGAEAGFYFFLFFESQTLLVVFFSLPILILARNPTDAFSAWEGAGVGLWIIANVGEMAADRELARFRSDPASRAKVCREGLWRYSRHPNYFFEWLHWWAYVLMGIAAPYGGLTLLGPTAMLFFLLKVTGIPHTEAQALASRGEDYRQYQRTTSAFIPWFPRE
jgi:steroid 5-alpha reductase family enzyme